MFMYGNIKVHTLHKHYFTGKQVLNVLILGVVVVAETRIYVLLEVAGYQRQIRTGPESVGKQYMWPL